jgi:hypothetical protein
MKTLPSVPLLISSLACLSFAHSLNAQVRLIPAEAGTEDANGVIWYDGSVFPIEGKGWTNTQSFYDRLPAEAQRVVPSSVWGLSHDTAGLCIRFLTDATTLQVRWALLKSSLAMSHMPATGVSGVDLYSKNKSGQWHFVANGRPERQTNTTSFSTTPGQENLLYFPLYNGLKTLQVGLSKGKRISVVSSPRKPIVFYGTSITQGGCASRPGLATPAIVGRDLEAPVINLGFSGSGRMEMELADLLGQLDASVYVLDCLWNMSTELVEQRVEPFVKKLRAARPGVPIVLAEDSSVRNITPTPKGRLLRSIHERLTKDGLQDIHFLSNAGMLGDDWEGTVDGCHPNDLGMMRQAKVFLPCLAPLLKPLVR